MRFPKGSQKKKIPKGIINKFHERAISEVTHGVISGGTSRRILKGDPGGFSDGVSRGTTAKPFKILSTECRKMFMQ